MIIEELKILKHHGIQYVKDLTNVSLNPLFRGRPEIQTGLDDEKKQFLEKLCPVAAISTDPFSINLGKCVFCKECEFAAPDKIKFTNDYKIATNNPENLIVKEEKNAPILLDEIIIRPEIKKLFSKTLKLRQISAAGDNSCEMELNACANVNFDMGRYGIDWVASPRHADGIVITGPISENMAAATQICYDAVPEPKIIVLVGTDAISGGIFANSKAVNREFLQKYKIDLYVPGNPIHPLTFINGILELTGRVKRK